MKSVSVFKAVFVSLVTITVPLTSMMLSITPLLSSAYPKFAQDILNIDSETRSAPEILSYVRSKIANPDGVIEIRNLSQRERVHLEDVSSLLRRFYLVNVGLILVTALFHWWFKPDRTLWWRGLRFAAIITLAFLVVSASFALLAWEDAFYGFHALFFTPGSWQFSTSATLIQNFPPRFWVFSSACVVGMLVLSASCLLIFARQLRPHADREAKCPA